MKSSQTQDPEKLQEPGDILGVVLLLVVMAAATALDWIFNRRPDE